MDQTEKHKAKSRHPLRRLMRKFGRDEEGSMIVFSLYLLVVMLVLGGMAVDFMRFESRRSMLQGVSDRAALAGANLRNSTTEAEAEAIALDYFVKAGLDQYLVGEPVASGGNSGNYRSVEVKAKMELSTFFLKLVGINSLDASSASKAIEGIGNVEISLVVDISGSMAQPTKDENGNVLATTKMEALQAAAKAFTAILLTESNQGRVSISLVPYSEHVNIGPTLFNALPNKVHQHDYSHCVDFPDSAFNSAALDLTHTYQQAQHFQSNYFGSFSGTEAENEEFNVTNEGMCPSETVDQVIFLSENLTALDTRIDDLEPRAGTSIFLGLKWGVALLDKSTRALVAGGQDGAFSGRPADYPSAQNPDSRTEKFVVLMTDGDNQWSYRLKDEYYDTPSERAHWDAYNLGFWRAFYATGTSTSHWTTVRYSAPAYEALYGLVGQSDGDLLTRNLCTAAKNNGIEIFAVAFEATAAGETLMADCASSPSHYFASSGGELTAIFEAIASQITDLRLTL